MIKTSKANKIIIIAVALLLMVVIVLAAYNFRNMRELFDEYIPGTIRIETESEHRIITLDDLANLNPREVTAFERGMERRFTGVPFATILEFSGFCYAHTTTWMITSIDGFRTALNRDDALVPDNAYIVFAEDGVGLDTHGGQWTNAPFMLIMPHDDFPFRWARYVIGVEFQ